MTAPQKTQTRDEWLIVLLIAIILLPLTGVRPLTNPDEGRYAEIPREMVASGDWVTPRLDGVKYFEKPPLVYWIEALAITVTGRSEWSLRLPIVLFTLGGTLLVYRATARLHGRRAARASALVLATSLFYCAMGGLLTLDLPVSVLMTAVLLAFIAGVHTPAGRERRMLFYALYASAALATLTKGLMGFLVPGAVMFLWLLLFRQWRRLLPMYLGSGTILFLVIAAPWHLLVAARNPEWSRFYFLHEHWERFTTTEHDRSEPWWFFLPIVVLGLMPWIGFLPSALRAAVSRTGQAIRDHAIAGFFVIWAAFIVVFFSLSGSKLPPYVLPAIPPLAILIGGWLTSDHAHDAVAWWFGWGTTVATGLVLGSAIAAIAWAPSLVPHVPLDGFRLWLAIAAAIIVAGLALVARQAGRRRSGPAIAALVGTMAFFYAGVLWPLSARIDFKGSKALAAVFVRHAGAEDAVFHYGALTHDFLYYAQRTIQLVDSPSELELDLDPAAGNVAVSLATFYARWRQPERAWVLLRRAALPGLTGDPGFNYLVVGETPSLLLLCNQALP